MLDVGDILVPRDFSALSDRAVTYALDLASRTEATVHALHVEDAGDPEDDDAATRDPAADIDPFREIRSEADGGSREAEHDVPVVGVVRRDASTAPAILQYATDEDVDLIVLGTHGRRGASRILLGSVAEEVVRYADRPVLTVRGAGEDASPSPGFIDRILVPVDFSEFSREAVRTAKEWAGLYGARIDLLHVIEETLHPAFYVGGVQSIHDAQPNIEDKTRARLQTFLDEVGGPTVETDLHVRSGKASSAISECAEELGSDLVAMSTHGRTGMERFFLGSVAEKVVRHVECPVLALKAYGASLIRLEK